MQVRPNEVIERFVLALTTAIVYLAVLLRLSAHYGDPIRGARLALVLGLSGTAVIVATFERWPTLASSTRVALLVLSLAAAAGGATLILFDPSAS